MKISQILKENTIDPDYTPNQYTLEQIEVIEFEDFENKSKNYHALKSDQEVINLVAGKLEKYTKIFKFNPTPDWEKSIYYKNFKFPDTEEDLILVYTAYNDSAEIAVIQQQYNGETFLRIHLRKIP